MYSPHRKNKRRNHKRSRNSEKHGTGFVEWRADCYEEGKNGENSLEMLKTIHCVLDKIPLLFTFRTDKEGGSQSITCEDYVNLLENAAKTGFVDLIDVEAFF